MKETMLAKLLDEKPAVTAVLYRSVTEYYADEQHEQAFREWYREKYGHEYEPKNRPQV